MSRGLGDVYKRQVRSASLGTGLDRLVLEISTSSQPWRSQQGETEVIKARATSDGRYSRRMQFMLEEDWTQFMKLKEPGML